MTMRWIAAWTTAGLLACGGSSGTDGDTDKPDDTLPADDSDTIDTNDTPPSDDTDAAESDTPEETDETAPPLDPCLAAPAEITAGTGNEVFQAVTAGQSVEMVFGPQGGWHIWGGLLARHVTSNAVLDFSITDVGTGIVLHSSRINIGLRPLAGPAWACEGTYSGLLGVLSVADLTGDADIDPPQALCGRPVEMRYTLHHPTGAAMGEGSIRIVAQPDPAHGAHCDTPTRWPTDAAE
ncbi:MAG TPA: hypothetical protein PKA64_20610 [Myxococcota bacterium]|nr:hypothetical protein [Myxococcota bacterium]